MSKHFSTLQPMKCPFALAWKVAVQTFSKQGDPCCPPEKADTLGEDNHVGWNSSYRWHYCHHDTNLFMVLREKKKHADEDAVVDHTTRWKVATNHDIISRSNEEVKRMDIPKKQRRGHILSSPNAYCTMTSWGGGSSEKKGWAGD